MEEVTYLQKAKIQYKAALCLFEKGYINDAISRLYYSFRSLCVHIIGKPEKGICRKKWSQKMIKTITKLDMLKKAQECLDKDIKLKGHVKIDIDEENKTDADLNLVVITDLPNEWYIRDKITSSIYQCLEEIDPYITIHFNWNFIS